MLASIPSKKRLPCAARPGLDLQPDEALVRDAEIQLRGLGHDGGVDRELADHFRRPEAGVLLVGHGCQDEVAAQARAGVHERLDGGQTGRQAPLHVVGAAAVQAAVAHDGGERVRHSLDPDGVQVGVEHQGAAAADAPEPADHARPPGCDLQGRHVHPQPSERDPHVRRDGGLARRRRNERGVDRVDPDQFRKRVDQVRSVNRRDGHDTSTCTASASARPDRYRARAASRPGTPAAPVGTVIVDPWKSMPTGW